jgi:hypothetical protein
VAEYGAWKEGATVYELPAADSGLGYYSFLMDQVGAWAWAWLVQVLHSFNDKALVGSAAVAGFACGIGLYGMGRHRHIMLSA